MDDDSGVFKTARLLSWAIALGAAILSLAAFAFMTFETKVDSTDKRDQILHRIDKLDEKVDRVIELVK